MAKIFLDTNILVYTLDSRDAAKQKLARQILQRIVNKDQPVISTQVLQEFYVAATTKLKVEQMVVKSIVHQFRSMEVVSIDPDLIEQAVDISLLCQLSFWDSLIVAAAEKSHCESLLSEDLNAGQSYRGVTVVNPFGG